MSNTGLGASDGFHSYKNKSKPSASLPLMAQTTLESTETDSPASAGSEYWSRHFEGSKRTYLRLRPDRAQSRNHRSNYGCPSLHSERGANQLQFYGKLGIPPFLERAEPLTQSERIFVDSIEMLGLEEAIYWAERFNLEYARPLQILKSMRMPSYPPLHPAE